MSPGEWARIEDESDEANNVPLESKLNKECKLHLPSRLYNQWGWKRWSKAKAVVVDNSNTIELVADDNGDMEIGHWEPATLDKKFLDVLNCQAGDTIVFERSGTRLFLKKK